MNQLQDEIKHYYGSSGRAKKSLGQHFLTSEAVLSEIVKSAEITPGDTIFEIGPGLGFLTKELMASPAREIVACEKDDELYEYLRVILSRAKRGEESRRKLPNRLKLIHEDALVLIPNLIAKSPLKVVANLPYNIAAPAIISLLSVCPTLPERMVIMVQKEVAERIVCPPGNSNRGLLTVFIELFGTAKIIKQVSRGQFSPPPQVDSAVIDISGITKLPFLPKQALRIIKGAFSSKRKKIKNSLFSTFQIPLSEAESIAKKCGFSLDQRPEELTKAQWLSLIELLSSRA
jgi:16S rRNA (adenine1518-N6/adenine1519-N6)-dimethyltransferase